jgi:hypothetical protein
MEEVPIQYFQSVIAIERGAAGALPHAPAHHGPAVQLADISRRDRCVSPEIERPCEWDLLTGDPCDEPAVRSFNVGRDWPERSHPGLLETFWLCEKHCTEATAIRDGKE